MHPCLSFTFVHQVYFLLGNKQTTPKRLPFLDLNILPILYSDHTFIIQHTFNVKDSSSYSITPYSSAHPDSVKIAKITTARHRLITLSPTECLKRLITSLVWERERVLKRLITLSSTKQYFEDSWQAYCTHLIGARYPSLLIKSHQASRLWINKVCCSALQCVAVCCSVLQRQLFIQTQTKTLWINKNLTIAQMEKRVSKKKEIGWLISAPSIEDLVIPMILPAHVGTKRFFSEAQRSGQDLRHFLEGSDSCLSFFLSDLVSFFLSCVFPLSICPSFSLFVFLSLFSPFYLFSPLFLSLLTPFFSLTKFSVSPSFPCPFTSPKSLVASLPLPNVIRSHDIRANLWRHWCVDIGT